MIDVDRPLPETVPRGPRLYGLARMSVLVLDDAGRVRHWNAAAEDLFGIRAEHALGMELRLLITFSPDGEDPFVSALRPAEPAAGAPMVHCAAGAVRPCGGRPVRDVAWWIYPLTAEAGGGALAFATDAERLRASGPGLSLSGETLLAPPDHPIADDLGVRLFHVDPVVVPAPPEAGKSLGDQILDVLRTMGAETGERLMEHVRRAGYPAMSLSLTAELPFAPYWGTAARHRPLVPQARLEPAERVSAADAAEDELIEARAAQERLAFLNETGARVGTSLNLEQTARELAEALVPRFADFAGIHLLDEYSSGEDIRPRPGDGYLVRRLAVAHDDRPGRWDTVVPVGEVFRLPEGSPWASAMTSGRAVHIPRVTSAMAEAIGLTMPGRDLKTLLAGQSLLIVPLVARGVALGNLVLQRKPERLCFDGMDVDAAEALAQRAALSMDNARLFRQESRASDTLQRGMLPDGPPDLPGLEVRYRYLPASRAVKVGGDWFDTIPLPGGRVALVMGDVMGHGLQSASVMGQLRTAVRTLAPLDLPPEEVLRQLDELAQRLGDDRIATCVYCVYDPVTHACDIGNAGHIPPVLIHPDGRSELLEIPSGAPIGVGGVPFGTLRVPAPPGSRLVLCTDGLVELRDQDIDVGLNALRVELAGRDRPLDEVSDAVIHALCTADRLDDVALLVARFSGLPGEDVVSWRLSAEPAEVRRARALTRAALRGWDLEELAETVELLVSELLTNAVRYAAGPVGLRLIRTDVLLCEVDDTGHHLPNLCRPRDDEESGRGVFLVSSLARRWGTHRTGTGKVVWFDLAL
ncbi:MAG: SpoIIE family protein phosphatase [Streptosporangiales bacterium]|nr:SpoIIE family protein phosphatase [Streptosporangiales bacterium]